MKAYSVKAYGEEYGLPNKSVIIEAENFGDVYDKAWSMFPEYEDVWVYEIEKEGAE